MRLRRVRELADIRPAGSAGSTALRLLAGLKKARSLVSTLLSLCVVKVALMGRAFSEDGKLLAYSLASGGSDWRTIKFLQVCLRLNGAACRKTL